MYVYWFGLFVEVVANAATAAQLVGLVQILAAGEQAVAAVVARANDSSKRVLAMVGGDRKKKVVRWNKNIILGRSFFSGIDRRGARWATAIIHRRLPAPRVTRVHRTWRRRASTKTVISWTRHKRRRFNRISSSSRWLVDGTRARFVISNLSSFPGNEPTRIRIRAILRASPERRIEKEEQKIHRSGEHLPNCTPSRRIIQSISYLFLPSPPPPPTPSPEIRNFSNVFAPFSRLVSPGFNRIVIVCLCIRKGVVSTRPVTISLCVRIADAVRYVYIHYIRIFEHSFLHLPRLRLPRIIRLYIVCTILSSSIASPFFFHFIISRNILSIDAYRIYLSLASLPLVFVRTSPESPSSSRGSRGSWIFAAPPPPPPPPRWLTFKVKRHELFHAHMSPPIIRHSRFWYGFSFLPIKKHPPVD